MPKSYFLAGLIWALAPFPDAAIVAGAQGYTPLDQASSTEDDSEDGAASRAGGAGFEISPNAGMMGGSALLGLRASMMYRPVTLEVCAEQVMGRAATLYPFTMNAILDLAKASRAVPFAIVGGGLFLTVPANTVGDETVSSMGLNFGGGLRFYLNPNLGIRFETKQLFTRVDNHLDNREELLIFQSSSLGVIFAFD